MATLTLTVVDADVPRIMAAFGYDPTTGVSQTEFARRVLMRFLIQQVQLYELSQARSAVATPGGIGVS